ncbi:hypothetical protein CHS0354_025879 [Potamilus streckersoni]|uniref:Transmembrane protein 218 n=1 Tax=Potamilus streckersoni TaxID=2493646 RepID=A0AAE0TJD5_9BIVA|nr:hypothetical protein CHS0354_025879 [Potamilus streckersoni]
MAGERVLGVGIGTFLIALVWSLALFLCVVFSRAQGAVSNAGIGVMLIAVLFSVILLVLPREETAAQKAVPKIYDYSIIYRYLLISGLGLFLLIGLAIYIVNHVMEPIYAKPLRRIRR